MKEDYIVSYSIPIKEGCIASGGTPIEEDYIAPHSVPIKEDYIQCYAFHFGFYDIASLEHIFPTTQLRSQRRNLEYCNQINVVVENFLHLFESTESWTMATTFEVIGVRIVIDMNIDMIDITDND